MTLEAASAEAEKITTLCGSSTPSGSAHCSSVAAVDLLDEYWFFKNTLVLRRTPTTDDAHSQEKGMEIQVKSTDHQVRDGTPALHRMPTLPPRLRRLHTAQEEAITPLKSCNPKLRHSLSSLDNYQSTSSSKHALSSPNKTIVRPPTYIKLERSERYSAIQHYIAKEAYYRKIFKEKKWRSHNDLECIEIQGFKDLGFVFDKEELDASPVREMGDGKKLTRPYLSEAWVSQKSVPLLFRCIDKRSAEDMKEQLKFWARAVASNARQEF